MPNPNTPLDPDAVVTRAGCDLWTRDIAELKRTKQPGAAAMIRQLKKAIKELRGAR